MTSSQSISHFYNINKTSGYDVFRDINTTHFACWSFVVNYTVFIFRLLTTSMCTTAGDIPPGMYIDQYAK